MGILPTQSSIYLLRTDKCIPSTTINFISLINTCYRKVITDCPQALNTWDLKLKIKCMYIEIVRSSILYKSCKFYVTIEM